MNRRIVLAGNNEAAVLVLDVLLGVLAPEEILVLAPPGGTRPDWQVSLARTALRHGVPCLTPDDPNDAATVEAVAAFDAGLLLSVYYTRLFRDELLAAVRGPALNVHPSLLPHHRGTAPIVHAIADGDAETGVSVHHIDLGVDTGQLVWQRSLPIHPEDTGWTLHRKAARLVRGAAVDVLRGWLAGEGLPQPFGQQGDGSYHSSSDPRLNHLDWNAPRARVRDVVRALAAPLPGAHVVVAGKELVLERVSEVEIEDEGAAPLPPGTIELGRDAPRIWAADGPLRIDAFQLHGETWPGSALPVRDGELVG